MIKLYNDDNYNIFEKLDDKSVDLVITDPPYEFFYKNTEVELLKIDV